MNKQELIDHIAASAGIEKKQAEASLDAICNAVVSSIKKDEEVSIFGFGKFAVSNRAARTGRNPQTGQTIQIAASKSVRFSPAKAFKDALN